MAVMTNALPTAQASVRTKPTLELAITMMEARVDENGDREFHFWGKLPDGGQGRAIFTIPGELGCDIIVAVQQQLMHARVITARGCWIFKNVAQGKNAKTFRIDIIDGIQIKPI